MKIEKAKPFNRKERKALVGKKKPAFRRAVKRLD